MLALGLALLILGGGLTLVFVLGGSNDAAVIDVIGLARRHQLDGGLLRRPHLGHRPAGRAEPHAPRTGQGLPSAPGDDEASGRVQRRPRLG